MAKVIAVINPSKPVKDIWIAPTYGDHIVPRAVRTPDPAGTRPYSEGAAILHPANASVRVPPMDDSADDGGDDSREDASPRQQHGAESILDVDDVS